MALYGKSSKGSFDHDPPICEVHKQDRKATDRRHAVSNYHFLWRERLLRWRIQRIRNNPARFLGRGCFQESFFEFLESEWDVIFLFFALSVDSGFRHRRGNYSHSGNPRAAARREQEH